MIRLYTAIGICETRTVRGRRRVVLQSGKTVYYPSAPETLLWGEAVWTVLTYEELETRFYEAMARAHLSVDISFDWYLHHLLEAGVLACGQDETLLDARYDLFKDLFLIAPGAVSMAAKLAAFCKMFMQGYFDMDDPQTYGEFELFPDFLKEKIGAAQNFADTGLTYGSSLLDDEEEEDGKTAQPAADRKLPAAQAAQAAQAAAAGNAPAVPAAGEQPVEEIGPDYDLSFDVAKDAA